MSKILIITLILLVVVVGIAWSTQQSKQSGNTYKKISAKDAYAMMQQNNGAVIVDVRTPSEFASGRIKNSINVPLQSIQAGDVSLLPNKNATLLVYCRSGNRSAQASKILADMGYTGVYDFGGIINWTYGTVR